jgi:hypothetical protein
MDGNACDRSDAVNGVNSSGPGREAVATSADGTRRGTPSDPNADADGANRALAGGVIAIGETLVRHAAGTYGPACQDGAVGTGYATVGKGPGNGGTEKRGSSTVGEPAEAVEEVVMGRSDQELRRTSHQCGDRYVETDREDAGQPAPCANP